MLTRLVARLVYPFWRLHRLVDGGELRDAITEWLAGDTEPWLANPHRKVPYRFLKEATVASPDLGEHRYQPGDVAWLPQDVGGALRDAVEPIEVIGSEDDFDALD